MVGYGASDTSHSGVPCIVNLPRFYLDFDYLPASVVDVGSDDKAFLAAVYSVSDGDDITRCDVVVSGHDLIGKEFKRRV